MSNLSTVSVQGACPWPLQAAMSSRAFLHDHDEKNFRRWMQAEKSLPCLSGSCGQAGLRPKTRRFSPFDSLKCYSPLNHLNHRPTAPNPLHPQLFPHYRISVYYSGASGVSMKLILMIFGCTDVTSNTIIIMNPVWNWVTTLVFERM